MSRRSSARHRRRVRDRAAVSRAGRLALAALAVLIAPFAVSPAAAAEAAPAPAADVVDGRSRWREPLRAGTGADGRADWIAPPRATSPTSADAGPAWVDIVVDGELKRVPRLLPPPADAVARRMPPPTSGPSARPAPAPGSIAERATASEPAPESAPAAPGPAPERVPPSAPVSRRESAAPPAPAPARAPIRSPTPVPEPSPPARPASALPVRDERPSSGGAPSSPSISAESDALAHRLRELGVRPVAAGRVDCAPAGDDGDALEHALRALADDVAEDPLDAGISRDWSLRRFVCTLDAAEPSAAVVTEATVDGGADRPSGEPEPSTEAAQREPASASDDLAGETVSPAAVEGNAAAAPDGPVDDVLPPPGAGAGAPSDAAGAGVDATLEAPPATGDAAARVGSGMDAPIGAVAPRGDEGEPDEVTSGLFVVDDDDVPAGFEMLAAPQSVWADIRFNGRVVGSTAITTTADEVVFDRPAEIVAMLEDVEDPERLVELLSAPLPTNADRVCFGRDEPAGCGVVEPAPVAVIYDEGSLTLLLFVDPALQSVQAREAARYLPPPERRPTSILSLYSAASRTPGSDGALDLSGRLLAAYGDGNVSVAADYGSLEERARLNELKLTHFASGHEFTAGTYAWSTGGATVDVPLLGVGFSTSFRTRLDMEQAFSSELLVYLPRRAIVQLVVDDRVLTGDSYAAGKQALDTSALPDGTYPVEIRIVESDGTTRSELRTFSKSASMPPRGEPVFAATAGIARLDGELFPDGAEPLVAGASVAQRLGDRSALTLGALQLGRDGFGQSELVYLGERLSLQAAFTLGRERTVGTSLTAGLSFSELRFGLSYRSFRTDLARLGDPVREELLPGDGEQWSVNVDRSFGSWSIGLSASRGVERLGEEVRDTRRDALRARRTLFRRRDLRGTLSGDLRETDGERFATLRLDVSFGRDAFASALGFDAIHAEGGEVELGQSARVGYGARGGGIDWSTGLYARRGAVDSAGGRVGARHALFQAGAAHDVDFHADGGATESSIATLSTHIGLDRRGAAIGGAEASPAGLIVSVDGEPAGAPFDIVVNGSRAAVGEIGSTRFVGLQPFESYAVKLIPRGVSSNGMGNDVHEFTLYPGNVHRIDTRAEARVLLIATLVDERGEPLANAVLRNGADPSVTDASGLLQAELAPGTAFEVEPLEGGTCVVTTPEAPPDAEVQVADEPLVCRPGTLPVDG